ncbi:MAG: 6-carboxytetrahydropterin synthase [Helicobacteraceae bacterium]|jgi:6-pyruvoyltetrahydropterin/6-carboxytetrahydropterin synthase|nr:6-carboxytetrahydropterin synthase [Helicobacteraceae bacterium]
MIIRKLFKFENAHLVRGSTSRRCAFSLHGHSYKAEILLKADDFKEGEIAIDFSQIKDMLGWFIDSFDHSVTIWGNDTNAYIEAIKSHSDRWAITPVNPSAEQFARLFFWFADRALSAERHISVESAIVHETDSAYARAFLEDVQNPRMGALKPDEFRFSDEIRNGWGDRKRFEKLFMGN